MRRGSGRHKVKGRAGYAPVLLHLHRIEHLPLIHGDIAGVRAAAFREELDGERIIWCGIDPACHADLLRDEYLDDGPIEEDVEAQRFIR